MLVVATVGAMSGGVGVGETVAPGGSQEWEGWKKGGELLECVGEGLMVVHCGK